MPEHQSSLTSWSSFYVVTGSSAAALTGLMFVVISLVRAREQGSQDGIATFSTPTVMHFAATLLVSAILVAPWQSPLFPGVSVAIVGLYGIVYILRIAFRTKRLSAYRADLEDWTWYNILPFVAYGSIFGGAIAWSAAAAPNGLFVVGGGALLLIFLGIRNAWDVVTFITIGGPSKPSG